MKVGVCFLASVSMYNITITEATVAMQIASASVENSIVIPFSQFPVFCYAKRRQMD